MLLESCTYATLADVPACASVAGAFILQQAHSSSMIVFIILYHTTAAGSKGRCNKYILKAIHQRTQSRVDTATVAFISTKSCMDTMHALRLRPCAKCSNSSSSAPRSHVPVASYSCLLDASPRTWKSGQLQGKNLKRTRGCIVQLPLGCIAPGPGKGRRAGRSQERATQVCLYTLAPALSPRIWKEWTCRQDQ